MSENIQKLNRDLQYKIRVLEEENAQLTERVEDSLLFGLISENIQNLTNKKEVFENTLERISILKAIPYGTCGELVDDKLVPITTYCSFSDEDNIGYPIHLKETVLSEISFGPTIVTPSDGIDFQFDKGLFKPTRIALIPFDSETMAKGLFVFMDDASEGDRLSPALMLLSQIVDMAVVKYDNMFLLGALTLANKDLESRVDQRTRDLAKMNNILEKEIVERKEKDRLYRLLADNVTDTIWIFDLATLTLDYISPSVQKYRGFTHSEAKSQQLEEMFSAQSYTLVTEIMQDELSIDDNEGVDKQRSRTFEAEQSVKGGGYIWVEITASFIRDKHDKPIAVLGVTRNIDERKRVEANILENEKKYRNLFENGSDLLCLHDLDGNLIETNLPFKKEYGWTREDLVNLNIRQVIPERHQEKFKRYLERTLNNGSDEGYVKFQTKSYETVVIEYRSTIIGDTNGNPQVIHVAGRDITERFNAEKALKESEEKYKAIVKHAPAGIYEFDLTKMKFLSVNDVMCEYTGYSEKEFLELDLYELLSEESGKVFDGLLEDIFENRLDQVSSEYKIRGKNQVEFWVLANARFFYENGLPKRAMAVVHDLTDIRIAEKERRKLENQLQNAKKLESLGTLAGGVAHDLNNILSGVVSYPDLLLLDLDEGSPLRAPLLAIKKSGEKAADIVQDLLTLARRGVGSRRVIDINQVVNDFLLSPEYNKIISGHDAIRIKKSLPDNVLNIVGSEIHISKTVMNLLANAVEAMPAGGEIKISTNSCYLDTAQSHYESIPEGEYTTLEISDMGIGIPTSDLERIFEPFYTKKSMGRSGTGLGMSVVWGTVKDHGGYIDIISEEGFGTVFILYFPASRQETQAPSSVLIEDYLGKGESILVIDDSEEQRTLATRMMQRLRYDVHAASSGKEAVSLVKNRQYDLLILDMIMPPGMDGLETYKKILEIVPRQKAIIASGYAESERVRKAQQLGAGSFIKKPFSIEKIGLAARKELGQV
jgi:two-component system, cell cycle sensor histidine kinase and response regulator CckA